MAEFQDDIILSYEDFDSPVRKKTPTFMEYIEDQLAIVRIGTDQLFKSLPKYSEAKYCHPEQIIKERLLSTSAYFREHFHHHLLHVQPTRNIIKHLKKIKPSISRADITPNLLLSDPYIEERLANLKGRKHRDQVESHASATSNILLKGGFLYPIVHLLMKEMPSDAMEYSDEVSWEDHKAHLHAIQTDRSLVRYAFKHLSIANHHEERQPERLRA